MRDIKFRGKNKDTGWVYGQLAYDINGNTYIIQEVELDSSYGLEETMLFATMWYRVDKETLGQYTGLKDKMEKEIYEGDIVKVKLYKGEEEKYFIGKVEYFGSNFIVDANNNSDYHVYDLDGFGIDFKCNLEDCEVIGNVWEDSDLLNDNKNTESY